MCSCPPTGDCYVCPVKAPVCCIDAASEGRFSHVPEPNQEDYIALGEGVVCEEADGR